MLGYLNMEAETAAYFDGEGYGRTGDVGCRDKDGKFIMMGRKKDVIRSS